MNKDLEEQLDEMGPEYRAVVARLKGACAAQGMAGKTRETSGAGEWLIAASLVSIIGIGFALGLLSPSSDSRLSRRSCPSSRQPPREYRADVSEMIATQNPDGSWKNDFLTRRNAAALKSSDDPAAQVAYKKAMRNLRMRGIFCREI